MRTILRLCSLGLLLVSPAVAARYPGTISNAVTATETRVVLRATLAGDRLAGRVGCRRCPVRGAFTVTCTASGPTTRSCTGTAGGGTCSVEGFFYEVAGPPRLERFEGTYTCGPTVLGAFGVQRRRR